VPRVSPILETIFLRSADRELKIVPFPLSPQTI
jgi:hypothetical protein